MSFLTKLFTNKNKNQAEETTENEEVSKGTKVKVMAALLVVVFSVYVAWWVQEPGDVRADVLTDPAVSQTTEQGTAQTEPSSMLAEATTESTTETMSLADEGSSEQVTQEISISDFAFDPAEVTVTKGTTVTWVNRDTVPHTITGSDFTSGTMDRGQSFSFTFKNDGVFDYYCSFHPLMKGTIIVGTGASALTGSESTEGSSEELPPTEEAVNMTTETAGELEPTLYGDTAATDIGDNIAGNLTEGASVTLTPEELMAQAAAENATAEVHASADESDKLASSGPEDFLYLGAFLAILFMKRRSLLAAIR
jgi:plastocyanin